MILTTAGSSDRDKLAASRTLAAFDAADVSAARLRIYEEHLVLAKQKLAPPKQVQARDAWRDLIAEIEREASAGALPQSTGGIPAESAGTGPLE
jgi:hypothetical protein